ncbi:DUF4900 domain-containing protein [Pseudothermotoga sp.]|uniref:DUF4900 domain-containing protein n=1 Tax=Pseudothermotoga sp. TaxID=2033661 RepID=UPI0031F62ED5
MKKGYVLIFTLVLLAIVSLFTVALLTNLSVYVKRTAFESNKNLVHLQAQNLLQLSIAFIKPYFSGVRGVTLNWTNAPLSGNVTWWDTFKKTLLSQSDGDFWRNFFQRVDENRYFNLNSISKFNETINLHGLSGTTIVVPITGTYQVGSNPYSVLLVSRAVRGKIEAYALAVLAVDFLNKYAYFTEKEIRPSGQKIYFITRDVIDGPMRSNDVIRVWGNPIFKSTVEVKDVETVSGSPTFYFGWRQLNQEDIQAYNMTMIKNAYSNDLEALVKPVNDFLNSTVETGIKLNLKGKTIRVGNNYRTAQKLIVEFKSAQGQGSDHFIKVWVQYTQGNNTGTDALFTLKPNPSGTGTRMVIHGESARRWLDLDGGPDDKEVNFSGILMSDLTVAVQNNSNSDKPMYVDGRYTIYSKENVEIYDHIVYEDFRHLFPHNTIDSIIVNDDLINQMKNATRTDFLNIVADKYILVKEKQSNLKITASLYSFDESFTVEKYDEGSPAGQLTIFGSLMQYYRGPVGTFSSGTIRTGYYKNYIYDYKILEGMSAIGTPAKRGEVVLLTVRGVF